MTCIYFGPFATEKPLKRGKSKGNFLLAEVVGYRPFSSTDAEATLERVGSIGHRWKSISVCPIVLAPSYAKSAWNDLRRSGVIALTLKDVFGRNIEELMRHFVRAISAEEADSESLDEIEHSLKLANGTVVSEGFIGNLTGALFELLIALGFRAAGFDTTLQKTVRKPDQDEEFEVDVVALRGESNCKLIECKGRHAEYEETEEDVKRHFHNRCRAAADAYGWNVTDLYEEVEAVYITSGGFSAEALTYANATKSSHGVSCSVMGRDDLLRFLRGTGQVRLVEIVKKYY